MGVKCAPSPVVHKGRPEYGRVEDWRGGGRTMGGAVAGGFRGAGASLLAMAPFPVATHQTGRAVFPHPLSDEIMPSPTEGWPFANRGE